ncbi:MAG: putative rane protein family [Sphaerisporangium sp.]|nr:putative rane protein family [Sphaerisporangium sp.]
MNWSLRACARHGHVTYAPVEEALRQRLRAETALGEAWRCLRCGDFTLGAPHGSGPADDAPIVLRGKALRDATILRLLAVFRWGKGLLVLAAAFAIWRFRAHQDAISMAFNEDLPLLQPLADKIGWNLDESGVVHTLRTVIGAETRTLTWIVLGLLVFGALLMTEGTGLWLLKRWGEYFAVVATSLFVPIEVYEIVEKVTWLRIVILLINLAAVLYILLSKRLFGLRGGHAAYEAERHETSLLEVETAALRGSLSGRHPTAAATTD